MPPHNFREVLRAIDSAVTLSGRRLVELSDGSPVLLVFLRHAGCTFCREALSDIARDRQAIEQTGTRIVLVHMGDSMAVKKQMKRYGLRDVDRISDPDQTLYRAFGLNRGRLKQLLGPKVLWRGFRAGVLDGHGVGFPSADSYQMPGLFLIVDSVIAGRFRHATAADRPDYAGICAALVRASAEP
jgi:hypothetical protein